MFNNWLRNRDGFSSNRRVILRIRIVSINLNSAAAFIRFYLSQFTHPIYKQTNKHIFQRRINFFRVAVLYKQTVNTVSCRHHVHEDVYTAMQMKQNLYLSKA